MTSASAESIETAGLARPTASTAGAAERDRLWRSAREQVLPGRLPNEAQRPEWRRLWQLDPSFRKSDGSNEIGTTAAADVAEGHPVEATGALAAQRDAEPP